MKIFIASDHAGFTLKEELLSYIKGFGVVSDLGTYTENSVDYPLYAKILCEEMKKDPTSLGVLICGSGIGMSISANRFSHIRAALCRSVEDSKLARMHNNANVLCLGARISGNFKDIVSAFFNTPFSNEERHIRRIKQF